MVPDLTLLHVIVGGLAVIGIHRLWHWEEIFRPARRWLKQHAPLPPLVCPACSPVWIGAGVTAIVLFAPLWVLLPFAWYPCVRAAMGLYRLSRVVYDEVQRASIEQAVRETLKQRDAPCPHCPPPASGVQTFSGTL